MRLLYNSGAVDPQESRDAVQGLREALAADDLEAAGDRLAELGERIEALAEALGQGESEFSESRFGTSDSDGRFEVRHILEGSYTVRVQGARHARSAEIPQNGTRLLAAPQPPAQSRRQTAPARW